jgi:hypothetical protein
VSYMRPDPSKGDSSEIETCHTVMRKAEIQKLLEAAQARREAGDS